MKKLPSIFQNEINKKIKNNREVTYIKEENKELIIDTINAIFNGTGYAYNIPVIIKTKNNIYDTYLVSKTNTIVTTLNNDIIPINEIISIERKSSK